VHVHVHALGWKRNARKRLALLIARSGAHLRGSLSLVLGVHSVLGHPYNGLFFFMAGNYSYRQQHGHRCNSSTF
jgi:hypothetical protein